MTKEISPEKRGFLLEYGNKSHIDLALDSMEKNNSSEHELIGSILRNPNHTPEHIERLTKIPGQARPLSYSRYATPEILNKLSTHPDAFVRENVARHKSTPKETRESMANDKHSGVRHYAAQYASEEKIPELINSKDHSIITGLMRNPNIKPEHQVQILSNPEHVLTMNDIGKIHPIVGKALSTHRDEAMRALYAARYDAHKEDLEHMAAHDSSETVKTVARYALTKQQ